MKTEARWLRRARPRPFGFAPGGAHPLPERIGEAHGPGTTLSGIATVLGLRTPVRTMTVIYGDTVEPPAPAARIISDFHRDYQDRDLEQALLDAALEWRGQVETAGGGARATSDQAELRSETVDIFVSGTRRPVSMLVLTEFSAFQVRDEGVLVTVLARHMGRAFPEIVRLTDLEPMLVALEHPDREVIAAAFAEVRRRRVEQMRDQTWDRP